METEVRNLIARLPESPLIEKALDIAKKKHCGKKRRIKNEPYLVHPLRVALLLLEANADIETLAAALTHDVLEDEASDAPSDHVDKSELAAYIGDELTTIMWALSDDKSIKDRMARKRDAFLRISEAPKRALFIKAADIIDNTNDLAEISENGDPIPWDVFHFTPQQKLDRWRMYQELISQRYPDCPLLPQLAKNLDIIEKSVRSNEAL